MPQRFSQSTEVRTSLYYTKGGIIADVPSPTGVGVTVFQIAGHTGFGGIRTDASTGHATPLVDRLTAPATPAALEQVAATVLGVVRSGTPLPRTTSYIDGAAAIKDLQDTILYYFDPAYIESVHETQTQELQLEFLNLHAPISAEDQTGQAGWIIHPHRNMVDLQQDAQHPFLYNYAFQFAATQRLAEAAPDLFLERQRQPRTGFQETLAKITQTVVDLTNGVNTIEDAFTQMTIHNVTGPVSTFLLECANLGDALGNVIDSAADKIRFPLYAQRTAAHVLDAPKHSVTTLAQASKELGLLLITAADPRSLGRLLAGEEITPGLNDLLTLALNDEAPQTIHLPPLSGGEAIAAHIQAHVQQLTPQHAANASAYRDFTASFVHGQYLLSSGTKGSDSGRIEVVVNPDPELTPGDASSSLGLGLANGGQEQGGSAYPNAALALLRGMEEACAHLQGFPTLFADQLEAQDAALAALQNPGALRAQIRGDQRVQQTLVTPGDSLQSLAARVGVDWQTLALVNRLTYPYIAQGPTTLVRGRVSTADYWSLTDETQTWLPEQYQGQRVDIVSGPGAGQSRRIVRHTATQLVLEQAWTVRPTDTSDYAICAADNPIHYSGQVTSATSRTLTDAAATFIPDSQRGQTLLLTSGPSAGARRHVVANDASTYTIETPWDVLPAPGALYVLLGPQPATRRQLLVGEPLKVPRPSAQARLRIRSGLADASAITGRPLSLEEQLFGRDMLLDATTQALVWDPAQVDVVTIAALPNLRQAVLHLVNVPLGELEYAPTIGSYLQEELGLTATLPLAIQLLASLERTVKQDSRIASVNGAQLVTQGGVTRIAFGATAINGSTVERVVVR